MEVGTSPRQPEFGSVIQTDHRPREEAAGNTQGRPLVKPPPELRECCHGGIRSQRCGLLLAARSTAFRQPSGTCSDEPVELLCSSGAIALGNNDQSEASQDALQRGLSDVEPLVRLAAGVVLREAHGTVPHL